MPFEPPGEPDDATLVARCLQHDGAAWSALVRRYQRLVHAIVSRMGLDEHTAGDVFQTVFERLLHHLPRLAEPSRLQAWIVTTAKREGLRMRERGRRTESMTRESNTDDTPDHDLADTLADASPNAEAQLEALQQVHAVRLGLDRLDAGCRDLLLLLFRDDDDRPAYDAVARRLGIPIGSIGPTRSRCLAKLRRLVEG